MLRNLHLNRKTVAAAAAGIALFAAGASAVPVTEVGAALMEFINTTKLNSSQLGQLQSISSSNRSFLTSFGERNDGVLAQFLANAGITSNGRSALHTGVGRLAPTVIVPGPAGPIAVPVAPDGSFPPGLDAGTRNSVSALMNQSGAKPQSGSIAGANPLGDFSAARRLAESQFYVSGVEDTAARKEKTANREAAVRHASLDCYAIGQHLRGETAKDIFSIEKLQSDATAAGSVSYRAEGAANTAASLKLADKIIQLVAASACQLELRSAEVIRADPAYSLTGTASR